MTTHNDDGPIPYVVIMMIVLPNGMYDCDIYSISSYKLEGFPRHLNVMHVEQEALPQDKPALQVVMEADPEIAFLELEEKRLTDLIEGIPLTTQ